MTLLKRSKPAATPGATPTTKGRSKLAPGGPGRPNRADRKYEAKREREAERQRNLSAAGRDIAPLPEVVNPKRRAASAKSFRKFCETYFPNRFTRAWSKDHLEVIADIDRIITQGGVLAVAMPRGSGKTSLAEVAVMYAALCHGHRFVMLIAATKTKAKDLLESVKTELEFNDLLLEDFPEACYPLRRLEGVNQRKPLFNGHRIHVKASKGELLLPGLPGTKFRGCVLRCAGLLGGEIRGASFVQPDGTRLRPSLFIADDPQTDASSKSDKQNDDRERILAGAVLGMAGPGEKIAGIVPCTVIRPRDMADRILDRTLHPEYNGRRYPLLKRMAPEKDLESWRRYGEVRAEGLRDGDGGAAGNKHWKKHRVELEALAEASWPARFKPDEVSAVQHAANLWLADRRAFFAEYQNDPAAAVEVDARRLDPNALTRRTSGRRRGVIAGPTQFLAGGVDCHHDLLYWAALGTEATPTGCVVDYNTWPPQRTSYFMKRDASPDIERALRERDEVKRDEQAQLYAALEILFDELFAREWEHETNGTMRLGKVVVDAGYLPDVVFRACKESKYSAMLLPSFGATKELPDRNRRARGGGRWGESCYFPPRGRRPLPYALVDSHEWISHVHAAFLAPRGAVGAWTLFDAPPAEHRCFADNICGEYFEDMIDPRTGRTVRKWKLKPTADNHWLDALKLAGLGCFELGCRRTFSPDAAPAKPAAKREPRVAYA